MDEPRELPSQEDLDTRLKRAQEREDKLRQGSDQPRSSALGQAMRVGIELVAGVAVGSLIGYLLDHWLGTRPWLMIVFFFLGSGAGMMNIFRVTRASGGSFGKRRSDYERDRGA